MNFINDRLIAGAAILLVMSLGAKGADYPATVLSQGPVGYWRLNETNIPIVRPPATNLGSLGTNGNGRYLYDARLGEPGALSGSTNSSVRFFNPQLDPGYGVSKVEVPYQSVLNPNGPFSVELWAKPTTVVTDVFCLAASMDSDTNIATVTNANARAGWLFYQNGSTNSSTNRWQFRLGNANNYLDNDAIVGGTVSTGVWHHLVGVFDGSAATLYVNGVRVASRAITGYQANGARPFRIGTSCFTGVLGEYAGNRGFDGWLDEVAFYGAALPENRIAAHYNAAKTNGINYEAVVLADQPVGYWRLGEPGNPTAVNLGQLGTNVNGRYFFSAKPGQAGPQAPAYPGLETTNRSCRFDGTNGFVDLPPLNLNTNTVTMTAWIRPDTIQSTNTGIVFCRGGTTVAGLKFDVNDPNGLSYNWNDDEAAYNFKSDLAVPVGQWSFVALMVQPDQAILCLQGGTSFATATNYTSHPEQPFEGDTLIGADLKDASLTFNGLIDEVAIFNRTLTVGEVFSQYASAVGGVKPTLFTDLAAPADTLYVGDTLSLSIDAGGNPPLYYQWRKNGSPISGATTNTFIKSKTTATDSGTYDVVITNAQGTVNSQSINIAIQPIAQPVISQDPQPRAFFEGGSLNLSVQVAGGELTYQWQKNGVSVPGATNATFRIASITNSDAGNYQVVVSNQLGIATSAAASITVVAPPADSYEAIVVNDGPEAWWRLDDPAGSSVLTDAMGRHDGVYKGGVTLGTPGVLVGNTNAAATFDGTSGYAEVPFSRALNTTNFSVECWVKANPLAAAQCPLASFTQPPGRGYLLQKSADGLWYYMFGNGIDPVVFVFTGSDAIYNEWTHLAITFDGFSYRGYLNGKVDSGADGVTIVPNNVAPLRIGYDQQNNRWNDFWNGDIDEVIYYSKALTADQIAAHYTAALFGVNVAPLFTKQPQSETAAVGSDFFLFPRVDGTPPIRYRWSKDGVVLAGQTNSVLILTNIAFSDAGSYMLTAVNSLGKSNSTPAILTVVPVPTSANVTNDLVLHLKFDGDYQDASGHGHQGQGMGSPRFVKGAIGSALHVSTLVDTNDPNHKVVTSASYVLLGKPTDLQFGSNVNFSVAYWVRLTNSPGDLPFLANSVNAYSNPGFTFAPSYQLGGWSWSLGDNNTLDYVGVYGPDNTINDGQWHHLAHTFNRAGSGITYLDGQQVDSRSIVPIGSLDTGEAIAIGQDPTGAYPEAGEIDMDDMGIWRRVLTDFEVYSIYSAGKAGASFDTVIGTASIKISRSSAGIQLTWQTGTLEAADDVQGPWSPVAGAAAPSYQVTPGGTRKFYRIKL